MTQPTLRTESLFKLAWPIYLQYATLSCVWLVDFWFYSHLSDAIAATVGQLLPVVWLGTGVIPVFAGTGVAVSSQYLGARQHEKVVPAYMMNLCLTTAMGLGFGAALWCLAPDIGRWMGLDATLGGIATTYLTAMSAYFIFLGVLVAYNAVLSSRGMTNWLMYSSFLVAALNLALASLFVLGFHWGVRAVVAASVTSTAAATLLSVLLVHFGLGVRFHWRGAFRQMLGVARPMLRIGISNAVEPMSYSVQQIILSTMIIALGVHSMAANAYAGRAQMFQITFSFSLALGAQILMGHWTGARRFADVDRLYWKIVRRAMLVAFIYAGTVWLFSDQVLGFFTSDPSIRKLGGTLLFIAVFYEPARAVNIISGSSLKNVGDSQFPLVVGTTFIWGILPVVYWVNHVHGLTLVGFWLFFAADEIIRAGINLWRWRTGKWKGMGIPFAHLPEKSDARMVFPKETPVNVRVPTR
jgi:putative MATE family efflux protein